MEEIKPQARAPRNRTISLEQHEYLEYQAQLLHLNRPMEVHEIENRIINTDLFDAIPHLPESFVDLLFIDPPYNLTKNYNDSTFKERSTEDYIQWMDSWFQPLLRTLRESASVYVCCDWRCSSAVQIVMEKYLNIHNRITWQREKGRGAARNWKNCSEDIWFGSLKKEYTFNIEDVKLKKKVIAPYKENGKPKDWFKTDKGNFRLTFPSNLWTDITVPFWSMPENTDHPTQKPEKLLARTILASSNEGDMVLDPFNGSGTTSVVANKLNRRFVGIELDSLYSCLALKRLNMSLDDKSIQGISQGIFRERNVPS